MPDPEGVEVRLRKYWSSPELSLMLGVVLAGLGVVLVGLQAWLLGILALVAAAVVFALRSKAGRRELGALLGGAPPG